jgi:hypothetical protein
MLDFNDITNSLVTWQKALIPQLNASGLVVNAEAGAFASAVADITGLANTLAANFLLPTATGDALSALGADRGILRPSGTYATATLTVTLSGTQPTGYQITPAVIFTNLGDALTAPIQFTVLATVPAGPGVTSLSLSVQSTVALANATLPAGAITRWSGSAFITAVTNAAPTSTATDPQADAPYLLSIQAALAPLDTPTKILKAVQAVATVIAAYVNDPRDGTGIVNVYAVTAAGTLVGTTTTPTATPSAGIATTVQTAARAIGGPGLIIKVAALAVTTQNLTFPVVTQISGSGLTSALVIAAVTTYLNSLTAGQKYYPSDLIRYLFVTAFPGQLQDVQAPSLTPVDPGATGIVRAGTILITTFT